MPKVNVGFSPEGHIILPITLVGKCGTYKANAMVDTGFTFDVNVPKEIGVSIGLQPAGHGSFVMFDGSVKTTPVFEGKVRVETDDGKKVDLDALYVVNGTHVVVGMGLILKYFKMTVSDGFVEMELVRTKYPMKIQPTQFVTAERLEELIRKLVLAR